MVASQAWTAFVTTAGHAVMRAWRDLQGMKQAKIFLNPEGPSRPRCAKVHVEIPSDVNCLSLFRMACASIFRSQCIAPDTTETLALSWIRVSMPIKQRLSEHKHRRCPPEAQSIIGSARTWLQETRHWCRTGYLSMLVFRQTERQTVHECILPRSIPTT